MAIARIADFPVVVKFVVLSTLFICTCGAQCYLPTGFQIKTMTDQVIDEAAGDASFVAEVVANVILAPGEPVAIPKGSLIIFHVTPTLEGLRFTVTGLVAFVPAKHSFDLPAALIRICAKDLTLAAQIVKKKRRIPVFARPKVVIPKNTRIALTLTQDLEVTCDGRKSFIRKQHRSQPVKFCKLLFSSCLLVSQVCASPSCAESVRTRGQKTWIFGIGISHYDYLPTLQGAENDVRAFALVLADRLCVPVDHMIVADDSTPRDRGTIIELLVSTLKIMQKSDYLIAVFSGHGFEYDGEQFLAPKELFYDEGSIASLKIAAISITNVKQIIREKEISEAALILDMCRSFPSIKIPSRISVLSATTSGQQAFESDGKSVLLATMTEKMSDRTVRVNNFRDVVSVARSTVPYKAASLGIQESPVMVADVPPQTKTEPKQGGASARDQLTKDVALEPAVASDWHYDHAVLKLRPRSLPPIMQQRD
jgi:hypothetical protein